MTVTQADRDAAAQIFERFDDGDGTRAINCRLGNMDDLWLVGFTAKHREDAERPLLERIEKFEAALRSIASCESQHPGDVVAIARQALGETK